MKKGMMVMTIVVALSFLVSIMAVSPSFAKPATQTTPTTKQQAPAQTPQTQSPQTQKQQFTPPKDQQYSPAKKFWDLEFLYLEVVTKGAFIKIEKGGGNKTINVKVGETVNFRANYMVITLPIGDITVADANYWGSGKFLYTNHLLIVNHNAQGNNYIRLFDNNGSLIKFTWANVKTWKQYMAATARKMWSPVSFFQWTPGGECVGNNVYINVFCADWYKNIPEPNESNNGFTDADLIVRFIVTP